MIELLEPQEPKRRTRPSSPVLPNEVKARKPWKERIWGVLRFPFATRRRRAAWLFLLVLVIAGYAFFVRPVLSLYSQAESLKPVLGEVKAAAAKKDLGLAESSLVELSDGLADLDETYNRLAYLKLVPFADRYYRDGEHLLNAGRLGLEVGDDLIKALKPYAAVLGLKGGFGSTLTAEEQLARIIDTLPKLTTDLTGTWGKLFLLGEELDEIDAERYPEEIRGVRVQSQIRDVQHAFAGLEPVISRGETFLKLVPRLLGSPKRTYLVIYQNDAEYRATGGFITGFSLLTVKGGQVLKNEFHTGAYVARATPYIKPPVPVGKYLRVGTWHFQDANFSPDFAASAKKLLKMWEMSGFSPVAGVVAINTETVSRILSAVGPLHVPGFDVDLAGRSNLPESCRIGGKQFTGENLLCRLEYYAEGHGRGGRTEERKSFLGDLADALIGKLASTPVGMFPRLIDLSFNLFTERDLIIYVNNKEEQEFFKDLGWAGRIKSYDGDYLHINDSNFGGKKTNMFMRERVEQSLAKLDDGRWRKTVKIKYYNPQPHDGWLSATYKDFVRIYVPKGSRLVKVTGANQIWTSQYAWSDKVVAPKGWRELGKTVFGAYFTLRPQQEHTLTFVYDLPSSIAEAMEDTGSYRLLMQKQPATDITLAKVEIGGKMETFDLKTDKEISLPVSE